jgi:hypothetical protein
VTRVSSYAGSFTLALHACGEATSTFEDQINDDDGYYAHYDQTNDDF